MTMICDRPRKFIGGFLSANRKCAFALIYRQIMSMKCTSGSAIAEGPRDVLVSRNSATTKYPYRVALFA